MEYKRRFTISLIISFMALLGGQLLFGTPVFAITDATITVNLGTLDALDLTTGTFGSVSQSINVTTDNYTGYTVNLVNSSNSTDLINTSDNTLVIPTITLPANTESITASSFESGYGVSNNGTNFKPAPSSSSSFLIGSEDSATTSTHTLTFAAKPATNTRAGSYSKTFVIAVVANNPQYSITYDANAGTDTVTDMPSDQGTTTSASGTITLPDDVPSRSGYTFLGWDTDDTATTPTYATGDTNTINLEPTQENAITLYAIWELTPEPVIADYTEVFSETTGPTASVTTQLTSSGGSGMSPSEYVTKIFAYSNTTGRTISSIQVEIVYSKANQGATSGYLIGKLNYNGTTYSATPVSVARGKVTNQALSVAEFTNLNIPSSSNISFTIGTDSDSFSAGITISSQTVTVTFAD